MSVNKKNILIFRDQLLPFSETFIPHQGESFIEYKSYYTGTTRFPQGEHLLPENRTIILTDLVLATKFWKTVFKISGFIHPKWKNLFKKLSPYLIHAHFGLDGVFALPLAKQLNIPLIVTFHGYFATIDIDLNSNKNLLDWIKDFKDKRAQFYRELYISKLNALFREAKCIIAVSEFIRSKLIEKGCPPEKIKVHYIGIDIDKFKPDPNIKREPIVLFVGRLVEKKGCEYLIEAMSKVQKNRPDVKLVIVGDGDLRKKLEKLAKNLLNNYDFLGIQTPEQVQSLMNHASVFCVPSIIAKSGDAEAFGMVFAEAQAMCLPVVSFASGGIPEAVTHGETGFLAPEKNIDILTQYILTLLEDEKLRGEFGTAGRKSVETKFNLKKNNLELEKIYADIIGDFN